MRKSSHMQCVCSVCKFIHAVCACNSKAGEPSEEKGIQKIQMASGNFLTVEGRNPATPQNKSPPSPPHLILNLHWWPPRLFLKRRGSHALAILNGGVQGGALLEKLQDSVLQLSVEFSSWGPESMIEAPLEPHNHVPPRHPRQSFSSPIIFIPRALQKSRFTDLTPWLTPWLLEERTVCSDRRETK